MGRPTKRASKIRQGTEFAADILKAKLARPRSGAAVYSWELPAIYAARNEQMLGRFTLAARLVESKRTDDALFVACDNRLAALKSLSIALSPSNTSSRAASIAGEAAALFGHEGIGLSAATASDIHGCLFEHGVAFSVNDVTPREDGERVDVFVRYWPIEFVRWDESNRCFMARVDSFEGGEVSAGGEVPITHGDGRWTIYRKCENEPWKHGAILASALVWARHAFAVRDWSKGSSAHGNAKVIGELPAGIALQDADGGLTAEASAFADLLRSMSVDDTPVGIRPAGSKTDYVTNTSTAWQVWAELIGNAEKAAARIYLGTDGTLGAQGGAPGVNIETLFGVATTIVQGDIQCLERGFREGVIEPWTAINFGDSALAPRREYLIPDADESAVREETAKRRAAFNGDIAAARGNGFAIVQEYVDAVAKAHGIDDVPQLPIVVDNEKATSIALAPADVARVVSVNEARASAGVGPLTKPDGTPDPDGALTVGQFSAKKDAEIATAAAAPAPVPAEPEPAPPDSALLGMVAAVAERVIGLSDRLDALAVAPHDPRIDALFAVSSKLHEAVEAAASARPVPVPDPAADARLARIEKAVEALAFAVAASRRESATAAAVSPASIPFGERQAAFLGDLKDYQARGLVVDATTLKTLAARYDVPVPRLARPANG